MSLGRDLENKTLKLPLVSQVNIANSRWLPPHMLSHLIPSGATNGQVALVEALLRTGGELPTHLHQNEDQFFYILEGHFAVEAGGRHMQARPGSFVWLPRGVEHRLTAYEATGRVLMGLMPGNFETWLIETSSPAEFLNLPPQGLPGFRLNLGAMVRATREFGVSFFPTLDESQPASHPFAVQRADAESIDLGTVQMTILAGSESTGKVVTVLELELDPEVSTPLHKKSETEMVYVLEGQARYQVGDMLVDLGAGSTLLVPGDTKSGYRNIGPGRLRMLHFICGGQFDNVCRELVAFLRGKEPDEQHIATVMAQYGWMWMASEIFD